MRHTTRSLAALVLTAGLLVFGITACSSSQTGHPIVAFMMSENINARWQKDADRFEQGLKQSNPDAEVLRLNANNDASLQQSQFDTALTKGATAVVLVAVDSNSAAKMANQGQQQGVPVIAYDHLINNTPNVAAYVSPDGTKQGEITGQWVADDTKPGDRVVVINGSPTDNNAHLYRDGYFKVLQPLFDSGRLQLVGEDWVDGWDVQAAQRTVEQQLTKNNDAVDVILIPWDDGAGVAAAAVAAQGLTGKVKITGGDGTAAALNRMLLGTQSMTVQRDNRAETDLAVKAVSGLLTDKKVPQDILNGSVDNKSGTQIPAALITPTAIGAAGIPELIANGWVTAQDVCTGVPAGTGPCR